MKSAKQWSFEFGVKHVLGSMPRNDHTYFERWIKSIQEDALGYEIKDMPELPENKVGGRHPMQGLSEEVGK